MDAIITKKGSSEIKLSDLGLEVLTFDVSAPFLDVEYRTIKNRSGRIKAGHRFDKKTIVVTGHMLCSSYADFKDKKENIYAHLVDEDAYYITELIPDEDLYEFELPGAEQGELNYLSPKHKRAEYRYEVINNGDIEFNFIGKYSQGLNYRFRFQFETANLPYGGTIPELVTVQKYIPYKGTAKNSQLESPWTVRLTSDSSQSGDFYVEIGDRRFEHKSLTPINTGDIFELKGVETWLNKQNVNDYTNFEYFVLYPTKENQIPIQTNFKGKIQIDKLQELYK